MVSVVAFTYQAFFVSPTRLEFVIGSPNGLGIFLVLSWFALQSCRMTEERGKIFTIVELRAVYPSRARDDALDGKRCSSCRWIDRLVRVARTQHKLEAIRAFHGSSCRKSRTLPGNRLLDVYGRRARRGANSLRSDLGISHFHGDTLEAIWGVP